MVLWFCFALVEENLFSCSYCFQKMGGEDGGGRESGAKGGNPRCSDVSSP